MLPWFRFYSEALHDPKLKLAAARSGELHMTVLGLWSALEALASESCQRGTLYTAEGDAYGLADLAVVLSMDGERIAAIVREFERLHMVEWRNGALSLVNWAKRQPGSDSSADRTQRWRDRPVTVESPPRNGDTPSPNRHQAVTEPSQARHSDGVVTPSDTDIHTDIDTDHVVVDGDAARDEDDAHDAAVAALKRVGMDDPRGVLAESRLPVAQVPALVEYALIADGLHSRPAWVRSCMRRGVAPDWIVRAGDDDNSTVADTPAPVPVKRVSDPAGDAASRTWASVLTDCQLQMTTVAFDRWLRGTTAEPAIDGGLVVRARDPAARDWLEHRLRTVIERAAANHQAGRIEFAVR